MAKTHKYGIQLPKSVKEAYGLNEENKNNLWRKGMEEEVLKVKAEVAELTTSPENLFRYKEKYLRMIFHIKLGENSRRKSRLFAGGHKKKPPSLITYSFLVSLDLVCICLMIAEIKDLDIQSVDIKTCTRSGPKFGQDEVKVFIIMMSLYGLKSSGAAFRDFLADIMDAMGFKSIIADMDVWIRPATKSYGDQYYDFLFFLCIDDLPAISQDAVSVIREVA